MSDVNIEIDIDSSEESDKSKSSYSATESEKRKIDIFTIDLDNEIVNKNNNEAKPAPENNRKQKQKSDSNKFHNKHHRSSNFLFQILIKAKNVSDNPVNFIYNVYDIVCNSFTFVSILLISMLLPIAMIVLGFIYKNKCLIQPMIPIWLNVFGSVSVFNTLVRVLVSIYVLVKSRANKNRRQEPVLYTYIYGAFCLFLSIWFIVGNVWVFSVSSDVQFDESTLNTSSSATYCNNVCYNFAYWIIIFYWIVSILVFIVVIGLPLYFFIIFLIHKYLLKKRNHI